MKNLSKAKWQADEPSLGAWVNLPTPFSAEALARMGFDWLCFDLQHGALDWADLQALIPAISGTQATPFVRVTSNDAGQIGRALDAGAHGVIVPMVNSVEEARMAAAACRYPPLGIRSCGPLRGVMLEGFGYLASANTEIACIAMIETEEGLENVEAIAAVPGVDALFIGPVDLCFGLGIAPGSFDDPRFKAALGRILAAAQAAGCAAGIYGFNAEMARDAGPQGFHFVSVGTDTGFLWAGAAAALQIVGQQSGRGDGPEIGY